MQRLRVGYVGVAYSSYFAEEHDQYGRAVRGLEELSRELDFELVAIPYGLTDMALTEQAAAELRARKDRSAAAANGGLCPGRTDPHPARRGALSGPVGHARPDI